MVARQAPELMYTAAIFFFGGAACLLLVATVMVLRTLLVLRRGTIVFGTITGGDGVTDDLQLRDLFVEFSRGSGQRAQFVLPRRVSRRHLHIGDRVPVIYNPNRRGSERVMSVDSLWSLPIGMAVVAMVLAVVGTFFLR